MLGKTMLTTMFDYNAAMNVRLLDYAANFSDEQLDAPSGYSVGSLRQTLWHTLIVEYGWRSQCQGIECPRAPLPDRTDRNVAAFRAFQEEEAARARALLAEASDDDLERTITLKRPDGSERSPQLVADSYPYPLPQRAASQRSGGDADALRPVTGRPRFHLLPELSRVDDRLRTGAS